MTRRSVPLRSAVAAVVAAALVATACSRDGGSRSGPPDPRPGEVVVRFADASLAAEVTTDAARWVALAAGASTAGERGALFVPPSPTGESFATRGFDGPIDVAFLRRVSDGRFEVAAVRRAPPCTAEVCPSYAAGIVYDALLQAPGGWLEDASVARGDAATIAGSWPEPSATSPVPTPAVTPQTEPQTDLERVVVAGGDRPLSAQVADDAVERSIGLMHRADLPPDEGMLFVYSAPVGGSFWMKNTLVPLSIAFLRRAGEGRYRVAAVLDMAPCRSDVCPDYAPGIVYDAALEANVGWFREAGVTVGDTFRVDLPGV